MKIKAQNKGAEKSSGGKAPSAFATLRRDLVERTEKIKVYFNHIFCFYLPFAPERKRRRMVGLAGLEPARLQ
ncbi:MAG: hypothetical protein FWF97_02910 [Alphaproteobacteria bacterium]|nr:hypothetical protein [Alphaproteobacteria bacterium]